MNPTEFREYVIRAFGALSGTYGLRPLPPSTGRNANPYEARFANATTLIRVEGINYGFNVNVRLASANGQKMAFESYDLGDLLTLRAPDFQYVEPRPDDTTEIQKKQIDVYADALERYAADVLRGDFAVFPMLADAIRARMQAANA